MKNTFEEKAQKEIVETLPTGTFSRGVHLQSRVGSKVAKEKEKLDIEFNNKISNLISEKNKQIEEFKNSLEAIKINNNDDSEFLSQYKDDQKKIISLKEVYFSYIFNQ